MPDKFRHFFYRYPNALLKKLDKLILKSFLGPFIVTFFISVFVLMMQILWKYIDDLVGKGIEFVVIAKFLMYASAALLALAMPIAILVSSIMTFGNLGEHFELVAIKSSGISLLRFMRPLIWVASLLCICTFLLANYAIPYSELKFRTLYNDIYFKKPAFALQDGIFFTGIPGFAIKAAHKEKGDSILQDVLVYEQGNYIQDNTMKARRGKMQITEGSNYLNFILQDGYRYQENGQAGDSVTEYVRLGFKEYNKTFDLSGFKMQSTNDSIYKNNSRMLSARQLSQNADSLKKDKRKIEKQLLPNLNNYLHYTKVSDSAYQKFISSGLKVKIPDSLRRLVRDRSYNVVSDMRTASEFNAGEVKEKTLTINSVLLELHKKFSLSMACLVLFFIGAPLGSIIRKGGLGMPLVVAIVFFLIFHLLNMFGEKFVRQDVLPPYIGMWLAVLVLAPVGAFFTYKAMNDSQLFSKEKYIASFKRLGQLFSLKKNKQNRV